MREVSTETRMAMGNENKKEDATISQFIARFLSMSPEQKATFVAVMTGIEIQQRIDRKLIDKG
jgi:hypothetical protein